MFHQRLKTILFIAVILLGAVFPSNGTDVTLRWDPNDPTPAGYRIFMRWGVAEYGYAQPDWEGSETTGMITGLDPMETYWFVVRAYEGTLESADSEEVSYCSSCWAYPIPPVVGFTANWELAEAV